MARPAAKHGSKKDASGLRLSEFLRQKRPEPLPVYVLRGTDPFLLDQGRRAVRAEVLGGADPEMALTEVLGDEVELADVLDALRTPPFLAPRRLVAVREADDFVKNHREALARYLESPSPCGSLCLEVSGWDGRTTFSKRVEALGVLVACETAEEWRIPRWLEDEARRRYRKVLTRPAAEMLKEYLGADFASLTAALESLALYKHDGEAIDVPDVDALVARGLHERIWALCDAVAEHHLPRALELLDAFWAEGTAAQQIVAALRPTLRQLVRAKALARRTALDDALARSGAPRFAWDRLRRALGLFTGAHLADAYQALVDADLEAKSSSNERMALETLVHRLCNPEVARAAGAGGPAD